MKKIRRTNKYEISIECENCENDICAKYDKKRNEISGYCYNCGYKFEITSSEIDFIQPDDPLFDMIYQDSNKDYEKKKKIKEWEEQKRLEELEEKYSNRYRGMMPGSTYRTSELKLLKNKVLKGEDL